MSSSPLELQRANSSFRPDGSLPVLPGNFVSPIASESLGPLFASMVSLTERVTRVTGQVTSFLFVGGSLGMMTVPWVIGQLIEPVGPQAIPACLLVTLSLALATVTVILVRRKNQALAAANVG